MVRLREKRSLSPSPIFDLSMVPADIFNLRGDAFYALVKELTSDDVEELLRLQRIATARCFLNTNPLGIFNLNTDDQSITQVQNRLSFKTAANKHVVLAGVDGDILYLKQLLNTFLMKNKRNKTTTLLTAPRIDHSQHTSPTATTMIYTAADPLARTALSIVEHRDSLRQQIETWCRKYCNQNQCPDDPLVEPDDYELAVTDKSAHVKCSCGQQISLHLLKDRVRYQLSHFYKHLTQNYKCTTITRKWDTPEVRDDEDSLSSISSSPRPSPPRQSAPKTTTTTMTIRAKKKDLSMASLDNSSHLRTKRKKYRR